MGAASRTKALVAMEPATARLRRCLTNASPFTIWPGSGWRCRKFKEISDALEVAKLNVDKEHLGTGAKSTDDGTAEKLAVINELQNKLTAAYANMSCAFVTEQTQKNETLERLEEIIELF